MRLLKTICTYPKVSYGIIHLLFFIIIITLEKTHQFNLLDIKSTQDKLIPVFFTVGSIFLTLLNFFIFTMKEKIFDDQIYVRRFELQKKNYSENSRYSPLKNVFNFICFVILTCFMISFLSFVNTFVEIKLLYYVIASMSCTVFIALFIILRIIQVYVLEYFELLKKNENS